MRLLIADDHTFFRRSLRRICEVEGGFTVVGEAANGYETIGLARQLQPDIVLMDFHLPLLNGLDTTQILVSSPPCPRIILLSTYWHNEESQRARDAGVQGYLPKDTPAPILIEAIQAVHHGQVYFNHGNEPRKGTIK